MAKSKERTLGEFEHQVLLCILRLNLWEGVESQLEKVWERARL